MLELCEEEGGADDLGEPPGAGGGALEGGQAQWRTSVVACKALTNH